MEDNRSPLYQYDAYAKIACYNSEYFKKLEELAVVISGKEERMQQFKNYFLQKMTPTLEEVLDNFTTITDKNFHTNCPKGFLYKYIIEAEADAITVRPEFKLISFSYPQDAEIKPICVYGKYFTCIDFRYKNIYFHINIDPSFEIHDWQKHLYKSPVKEVTHGKQE